MPYPTQTAGTLRQRTAFKYAFIAAALATGMANATTITVTSSYDSGSGSLRQAIIDASAGDTITFDSSVTIVAVNPKKGTSGGYSPHNTANNPLTIDKNLTIDGDLDDDGVPDVTISGQWRTQVLEINSGVTVTLDGVKLMRGALAGNDNYRGTGGDALGAGILNGGTLTLHNSVVARHVAGAGGAGGDDFGGGGFAGGTAEYDDATGQFAGNSNSSANINGNSVGGGGGSSVSFGFGSGVGFGGIGFGGVGFGSGGGGGFGSGGGGSGGGVGSSIDGKPGAGVGATAAPSSAGGDGGRNGNGQYKSGSGGGGHQQITTLYNSLSWAASGGGAGQQSFANGGNAAGGIYNATGATLTLSGNTDIKQNIGAGGGGHYVGGRGIGGIWNAGTLRYSAIAQANLSNGDNREAHGGGATIPSGSTDGVYSPNSTPTTTLSVSNVTATTADGTYAENRKIAITVQFSATVDVTGTPQLTLETGTTDQTATYTGGSGTDTLTFTYTVQAGDESTDLAYLNPNALVLNGGTINEAGGSTVADLTLPTVGGSGSLSNNKAIVIDTTAPTVSSVTATTADGTYGVNSEIAITVQFSAAVNVNTSGGTPQLTLETGTNDRIATYDSSSASNTSDTLTFTYTVEAGDESADLAYLNPSALALNGGTINEAGGSTAADLTLPTVGGSGSLSDNKNIIIEAIAPTLSSNTLPSDPSDNIELTFSENVKLDTGNIVIVNGLDNSDTRTFDVAASSSPISVSGSTVTISPASDLLHSTTYYVTIANTAITDTIGNAFAGVTDTKTLAFTTNNVAPSSQDTSVTLTEDDSYTFKVSDFPFIDKGNDSLASVILSNLPSVGKLTLNGTAVNNGQSITAADIGNLVYTPPDNFNDSETLRFQVVDQSGANSGYPENTLTINITPVDDAITFTPPLHSGKALLGDITRSIGDNPTPLAVDAQGNAYVSYQQAGTTRLSKLTANGQLDTHFGNQGSVALGTTDNTFSSMVLAADGSLYLNDLKSGGLSSSSKDFTVYKRQADGTPDTTFGTNGKLSIDIDNGSTDYAQHLVLNGNDLFILGETGNGTPAVVKVDATTGLADTTFANNGILTVSISGFSNLSVNALTVAADGTLWLAGSAYDSVSNKGGFAVVKISDTGVIDSSFGTSGLAHVPPNFGYSAIAQGVIIGDSGEILVGGTANNSNNQSDFALVKLAANGALDTGFGTGGFSHTLLSNVTANRVLKTTDGGIVISGNAKLINGTDYIAIVKFKQNGDPDISFGFWGIRKHADISEFPSDLAQGVDGSLFISGFSGKRVGFGGISNVQQLVIKLRSDGFPDTHYGEYAYLAEDGYQPSSSLDGTATFAEGGEAVIMDSDVVIFDVDLNPDALQTTGNYGGVTLTVSRDGGANADDVFSGSGAIGANQVRLDGGSVYVGAAHVGSFTQTAGELVITFVSGTTQQQINTVASGLAYKNTSTTPPASVTIAWVASDGITSDSGTTTVNITATDNIATASISGLPVQGQTLTASATDADGTANSSFAYEWFADGTAISGATADTYELTQAEVGKAITVQVSFNDDAGNSESPTSAPTTAVLNVNDLPSGQVRIEGVPVVEYTLTTQHDINDADMIDGSLSYQWYANGVAISGATAETYTLVDAQANTAVTVTISYRDQGGNNESLTSAPVAVRPAGTVIYLFSDSFE